MKKVRSRDHGENDDNKMVLDESLPKRVSYKEILVNRSDLKSKSDNKDDDEISIHEDDVEICLEGSTFFFLKTLIFHLFGKTIKYRALDSRIKNLRNLSSDHQLVDLDNNNFLVKFASKKRIQERVSLHYRYYGKGLLRIIGDVVGQVANYNTTLAKRGRFTMIAIFVDLNKP